MASAPVSLVAWWATFCAYFLLWAACKLALIWPGAAYLMTWLRRVMPASEACANAFERTYRELGVVGFVGMGSGRVGVIWVERCERMDGGDWSPGSIHCVPVYKTLKKIQIQMVHTWIYFTSNSAFYSANTTNLSNGIEKFEGEWTNTALRPKLTCSRIVEFRFVFRNLKQQKDSPQYLVEQSSQLHPFALHTYCTKFHHSESTRTIFRSDGRLLEE